MKSRTPKPPSSTSRRSEPGEPSSHEQAAPDAGALGTAQSRYSMDDIPVSAPPRQGGTALPAPVQAKMEQALGADFSTVQVHVGGAASDLGARALTQGEHVHFSAGEYQPHTRTGQEILGHELAHVVQQRQGRVAVTGTMGGLGVNTSSALESEADRLGAQAARGEAASPGAQGPVPQGGPAVQAAPVQRKVGHAVQFKCSKWGKNIIPKEEQLANDRRAASIILNSDLPAHQSNLNRVARIDDNLQAQSKAPSFLGGMSGDAEDLGIANMASASAQSRAQQQALVDQHSSALQGLDKMKQKDLNKIIHRKNSWQSAPSSHSSPKGGSGCFLTTACVAARGLPDDCEELRTLRQFRDGYMRALPEGPSMIQEYYRIAPAIVRVIDEREDARALYAHIYAVVTDCVEKIRRQQHASALAAYRHMVLDLKTRCLG